MNFKTFGKNGPNIRIICKKSRCEYYVYPRGQIA